MAEEFDAMEFIWERIPKTRAGLVHYLPGDLPYLYFNGFVDTTRITIDQWHEAFENCKQKDGTYLVSKEKFLALRPYRYNGPVFKPFDPQKVTEGEWTDADLQKLFDLSIKPSTGISQDIFWNNVKALKSQGLTRNGNLMITKTVKNQLMYLVEQFPSPRRRLEIEVNRIQEERESQLHSNTQNRETSGFSVGKMASENKLENFKKLQGTTAAAPAAAKPSGTGSAGGIDIKKLRKPTRRISG